MDDQFRAVRFVQGVGQDSGQTMYLFAAPAKWLIDRAKIDKWKPGLADGDYAHQGYQRELSESHLSAISRYLAGTIREARPTNALPVFPTSVLLAVRSAVSFKADAGAGDANPWVRVGNLDLAGHQDIFIIDGQHRIAGLRKFIEMGDPGAELFLSYHLPVTLMVCENKIHELTHFLIINREAKSVRTDLAERLLDTVHRERPELIRDARLRRKAGEKAFALSIVRALETRPGQPWIGRIALPNQRRKGERVASEGQLSKSLRHIVLNRPLGWSDEQVTSFVIDFWKALAELLPAAFQRPRDFLIQRAVGFGPLHQLLPGLASAYSREKSLRDLLSGVEPYFTDAQYWEKGGEASQYSSEGGYKIHAALMKDALNDKLTP